MRRTASRTSSSNQAAASSRSRMSTLVLTCTRGRAGMCAAAFLIGRCREARAGWREEGGATLVTTAARGGPWARAGAPCLVDVLAACARAACKLDVDVICGVAASSVMWQGQREASQGYGLGDKGLSRQLPHMTPHLPGKAARRTHHG